MPKTDGKPTKLVNRGPAGLLSKDGGKLTNRGPAGLVGKAEKPEEAILRRSLEQLRPAKGPLNRIRCKGDVVPISSLTPDPNNARLHPERNIESIEDSLNLYGQLKPLVVRKRGRVVMAGNGTLEAARRLGWTKVAVSVVDLSEVEAAGYGLADNRTAEHARWDFEVVARLQKLIEEGKGGGVGLIGWTERELIALRLGDSTPEPQGNGSNKDILTCPECGFTLEVNKNPSDKSLG